MNDESRRRLKELCDLIANEKDATKTFVAELNELLDGGDYTGSKPNPPPKSSENQNSPRT